LSSVIKQEQQRYSLDKEQLRFKHAEVDLPSQIKELENSKNRIFNTVESSQRILDKIIEIKNTFNMAKQIVPLT
jgi:hypothetical protein